MEISGSTGTNSHADRQAETLQHRYPVLLFSKKMTENIEFSLTSEKNHLLPFSEVFLCQHREFYG